MFNNIKKFIISCSSFNNEQRDVIYKGIDAGLCTGIYAKYKYNARQMNEIYKGLLNDLNVFYYTNSHLSYEQMRQIRIGLEERADVSKYAFGGFNYKQMHMIRIGLLVGIDVSLYATTDYTYKQMNEIRLGLEKHLDVSIYSNPCYSWEKMHQIYITLCNYPQRANACDPNLSLAKLRILNLALTFNYDVIRRYDKAITRDYSTWTLIGIIAEAFDDTLNLGVYMSNNSYSANGKLNKEILIELRDDIDIIFNIQLNDETDESYRNLNFLNMMFNLNDSTIYTIEQLTEEKLKVVYQARIDNIDIDKYLKQNLNPLELYNRYKAEKLGLI